MSRRTSDRLRHVYAVSATFRADTPPYLAAFRALRNDTIAVSAETFDELIDVLFRPAIARFIQHELRARLTLQLRDLGAWFSPGQRVTDCRDATDNRFLELALAASARTIVSSDLDLLALHPWRGIRILRPADYLASA